MLLLFCNFNDPFKDTQLQEDGLLSSLLHVPGALKEALED